MNTHRQIRFTLFTYLAACLLPALLNDVSRAAIEVGCGACHTMHNSQDGIPMAWNADGISTTTPNDYLLRSTCYGCHAQGGNSALADSGTYVIPQVLHTDATDLAGGNFAYITGDKGSGGAYHGHNIKDLAGSGADDVLSYPPGVLPLEHSLSWELDPAAYLKCDGIYGCHGYRNPDSPITDGIKGAHHANIDGQLDVADVPGNSYRFLMGVKGYEDTDWEYTNDSSDHNEYHAKPTPTPLGCNGGGAVYCHDTADGTKPPDNTMSHFCATCHAAFHTDATANFVRHPVDLTLPNSGEFTGYTIYSVEAPVARTTAVPSSSSNTITLDSDAVMCLSCHRAHASPYPDMLRWNYDEMVAGGGGTGGCFTCHTEKN